MTHSFSARVPANAQARRDALTAERELIKRELMEVQAFLGNGARKDNVFTAHLNYTEWQRERAAKAHRYRELSERIKPITAELKKLNVEISDVAQWDIAARFYNAIAELEESGVDVGDTLRALLKEFENDSDNSTSHCGEMDVVNKVDPDQRWRADRGLGHSDHDGKVRLDGDG